jgi:chromosome segregation and condensation protein ScpB
MFVFLLRSSAVAGRGDRQAREAQAKVLRAVLLAGKEGLTEKDLEARCEGLSALDVEDAVEDLRSSGLLDRQDDRLRPSGAATRFDRLRPL